MSKAFWRVRDVTERLSAPDWEPRCKVVGSIPGDYSNFFIHGLQINKRPSVRII